MLTWICPDLILDSVTEITPELLQKHKIRFLLLDVDCTLKRYNAAEVPEFAVQWIDSLQQTGIRCCILSNGRRHRIQPIAEQIQIPFVAPAMKPAPWGCRSAVQSLGFDSNATAIVGDQVFADILAGKTAGIFTILVKPIHPEEERWYTRIKRPVENWVLKKFSGRHRNSFSGV